MALLLVVLTDTARLWLARIELQNALDAAALSAVKTRCQFGVSPASDAASRGDARAAYLANFLPTTTPSGVAMSTNGGGAGPNGNLLCPPLTDCPAGLVLLGSIFYPSSSTPSELVFDGDEAPDKSQVVVRAGPAPDTFGAPATFSVSLDGAAPVSVLSLTIDLSTAPAAAEFDPGPGVSDAGGYGPFPAAPLAPIAGYSLASGDASSPVLTVAFDGTLTSGVTATFGIDTDPPGSSAGANSSADLAGATVTAALSDGRVLAGMLTAAGGLLVESTMPVGSNECAVQVHGCVEIESICANFLGNALGPYRVTGRATAWYRCQGPGIEPELVRVDRSICGGVTLP